MWISRFFGHLKTVIRHRHAVIRYCFRAGIGWQGLTHDLSKFSPTEFWPGVRYYTNGRKSPNEAERAANGFSRAWMHHKGRNRHHFEYWQDYDPVTRRMAPVPMPARYVAEMFCDRVAASRIYLGRDYTDAAPLAYFERGHAALMMTPQTAETLARFLRMLAQEGEQKTLRALKAWQKAERKKGN